ncbi:MAG TPA: tetratricopeptide repeat protein [Burkholderiales bacterium]|nr:tetratricopeptide repeat protein [Burkholderiales bacterium]
MGKAERQRNQLAAGWKAIERNEPRPAEEFARAALLQNPRDNESLSLLGASLFLQQRFQEAVAPLREAFDEAHKEGAGFRLGYCYLALGDPVSASAVLEAEVKAFPKLADAYDLLAISLMQQSRHEEALAVLASAVERDPRSAGTHLNLGNALTNLRRYEEAIPRFRKAMELQPGLSQAHNNLGHALRELGRFDEAIASYEYALRIAPDDFEVHNNLGLTYQEQGRLDEAAACFQSAISLNPDNAAAHASLGMIFRAQQRLDEAITCLQKALSIKPDDIEALVHLGAACQEHGRLEEAVAHFQKAILLMPDSAEAHHNLGISLQALSRHDEAITSFQRALEIDPAHKYTLGALLWSELGTCRWEGLDSRIEGLRSGVRKRQSLTEPFTLVAVSQDPGEQRLCAERFFEDRVRDNLSQPWKEGRRGHSRIRVAYLSGDFREHAVAYCIAEVVELHDRSKFEVIGASFGVDDGSEMRARLARGFDRFLDVRARGDSDAAKVLRDLEVDIAVDLMGYTRYSRPGILARRPAPVQVGYLGYPGTLGADLIDYVLADKFVVPEEHHKFYSERIVTLPGCYQANDSRRKVAGRTPTRAEAGLPEKGFVFCCFNNSYKILPAMFDVWMRLLTQVPGGVLWILEDNGAAAENLRREARARGVDPARLVFAPRIGAAEYRARCSLADLCLDTLPYNGHGTTGDMLWAGLPVLTCAGSTFAGRVAGSLLHAVGLPELVTASLEEYQALALKLARGDRLLGELRARLRRNRASASLFDTDRFRRHIESAYRTMWETWQRGDKPRAFAVEPVE